MAKNVKVVKVETVKGGKADRIVLHYVGSDGTPWKIGALAAKLDENSRKALLTAKEGGTLSVNIAKEGNYWNLVSAGPEQASDAPRNNSGSSSDKPYNKSNNYSKSSYTPPTAEEKKRTDVKIQVMNALTNAIVSLGAGKSTAEYKQRVVEFVSLGNEVVQDTLAGNLQAPTLDVSDDVVDELGF
jgi:hypothetical protein